MRCIAEVYGMAGISLDRMDSEHFDVLKEMGNIGAGNATTALSKMLNIKIDMQVPKIELLEFKEVAEVVGGAENLVVGILLHLEGDIDGMMMFMVEKESAETMLTNLMGGMTVTEKSGDFSEMGMSAMEEIGNIIAGAYLNSLSMLTNLTIAPSIPYMCVDMAGAILSVPAIEFGKVGDKALLIETEFGELGDKVNGFFILVPTLESYDRIFGSIGM
jgi:chemotaxis protein CheC